MKHRIPRSHQRPEAEGRAQLGRAARGRDRGLSHEIRIDRLQVGLARLGEGRVWERREQMTPVASDSLPHRALEGAIGPGPDACRFVGSDVRGVDRAEGSVDGAAARERRSGFRRVAMDATPKIGEHATTLDRRGGPCRGVRPRDGRNRAANRQRGYSERSQRSERRRDQRNKPGLFPACGCPRVRRGKHRPGRLFGEPRFAQAFEDAIGREGWFAEAHSGRVEDRVGDGRRARHRRGFANSERLLLRPRNHQHIDGGDLRERSARGRFPSRAKSPQYRKR